MSNVTEPTPAAIGIDNQLYNTFCNDKESLVIFITIILSAFIILSIFLCLLIAMLVCGYDGCQYVRNRAWFKKIEMQQLQQIQQQTHEEDQDFDKWVNAPSSTSMENAAGATNKKKQRKSIDSTKDQDFIVFQQKNNINNNNNAIDDDDDDEEQKLSVGMV
jgi:hypothetical protein